MQDLIIFTDLDGSLLNHEDYSFRDALPALARIRQGNIALVFVTSKTREEVEILQQEMGLQEPFVVENGGGIFFPADYRGRTIATGRPLDGYSVIEMGISYARIREFLAHFGSRFGISGFGDWSLDEIAARTGLPVEKAALARQREFSEPFLPDPDADIAALQALAGAHDFKITRGGRFYHLTGKGHDKGAAVRTAREILVRYREGKTLTIGIGDSENDLPMLEQVDIPIVIPRLDGTCLDLRLPRLVIAENPGSRGWNAAVESILDEFTTGTDRDI